MGSPKISSFIDILILADSFRSRVSIPADVYLAPRHFKTLTQEDFDGSSVTEQLQVADLGGKQLWHFTAPANFPFKSVTNITRDALAEGGLIEIEARTSDATTYGLFLGTDPRELLLRPSSTENMYVPVNKAVSRTIHIRQIFKPPSPKGRDRGHQTEEALAAAADQPKKAKPKQPRNLRMRYRPFGVAHGAVGDHLNRSPHRESEMDLGSSDLADGMGAGRHESKKNSATTVEEVCVAGVLPDLRSKTPLVCLSSDRQTASTIAIPEQPHEINVEKGRSGLPKRKKKKTLA